MSKEILQNIIEDCSSGKPVPEILNRGFVKFFRSKNDKFSFPNEPIYYENENFTEGKKIAETQFTNGSSLICSFLVKKFLTERSGKKAQYELAKKVLKENQTDAGIFVFYDPQGNFRFSLIYTNYLGRHRDWSNFRRFTYFVSKEFTNKTFLNQIGNADFSALEKIKDAFSVEKVTKEFYEEIANWYFWAMDKVEFPDDEDKNRETRNAKNLIRLITRVVFVWFMKVKKLIPETLFDKNFVDNIINYKDKTGSTYYKAILQNLFFATLNTQMKKDDSKSRLFIDEAKRKGFVSDGYLQQGYYRYERFIKDKSLFLEQFQNIPFLNGGLFDCLDKRTGSKEIRIDCFSDNTRNEGRLRIPDELFFSEKERVIKKVRGLITILKSYNFTIDENTPVDEEVALDPELLGKVFENLLASYVPETRTTARKSTGSYYTPREIVEYMVNESIIAYLKTKLSDNTENLTCLPTGMEDRLRSLLDYNIETNPFENEKETTQKIIDAIESVKILDPACGSGAFPMGVLHKLVLILNKLDPENTYWKNRLLEKIPPEIKAETELSLKNKPLDYIRKLGLIEHCIYGVDIQGIAIQISKLRFFISLLVEQQIDDSKPNRDIRALPNLETKFVAANALIGLEKLPDELFDSEVSRIIKELFKIREEFFYANSRWKKKELEEKENKLKETLIEFMQRSLQKINKEKIQEIKIEIQILNKELDNLVGQPDEIETIEIPNLFGEKEVKKINKTQQKRQEIIRKKSTCETEIKKLENPGKEPSIEIAKKIADFNPYDQNKSNSWFHPEWMFGIRTSSPFEKGGQGGFDIVIANPPYIRQEDIKEQKPLLQVQRYEVFNSTSDIYTYFYEKGYQILKIQGILCFISSNKWMRAKYGEKLRKFFKEKTALKQIIDFNGYKVFDATVDTNIMLFQKEKPTDNTVNILNIQTDFTKDTDINNYFQSHNLKMRQSTLDIKCFTFRNEAIMNLKAKIEKVGAPLKDWDVKIYRGLITGCNEAFIINTAIKEILCKEDRRSTKVIKPVLKGRDIERYYYHWTGLWMVIIPSGWTNQNRGKEKAELLFKNSFPAIYKYLKSIGDDKTKFTRAKVKSKGLYNRDDQGNYWWELRDCDYYTEFEKEKIIYCDIGRRLTFASDKSGLMCNNTCYFINSGNKYLLGILNSHLIDFYYRQISAQLGSVALRSFTIYIEQLPIPKISETDQKPFIELVDKILAITNSPSSPFTKGGQEWDYLTNSTKQSKVKEYEHQIDQMVYKLYGLTADEINIIEGKQ